MAVKKGLFPSWDGLLLMLADKLQEESRVDQASIVRLFVKMKQLNKAADEALPSLGKAHFRDVMKDKFGIQQPNDADLSLQQAIWSLEPRVVVTTNYDRVLEWAKPSQQAVRNSEAANLADLFSQSTPDKPAVWHLHGHISDPDSLILSPTQYNALYRDAKDDEHPLAAARQQLRNLISNHPLLFIGFGLYDEYVMDALATVLEIFGSNLRPSYALLKKGDDRAEQLWEKYQITVIPYEDHGQPLVDLIKHIRGEANTKAADLGHADRGPQPIPASYFQWLTAQCADITPFGMAPTDGQSVSLSQVYVPPVTMKRIVHEEHVAADTANASGSVRRRKKKDSNAEPEQLMHPGMGRPDGESQNQLLLDRLGEESIYISGDPGSGKSTFCRWISWLVSTGEIPRFEVDAPDEFRESFPDSLRGRLPVLVRLREFGSYLPGQPGRQSLTVSEFQTALEKWLHTTKPGGLTWNHVAPHLTAGSLLLILDGVDELPMSEGEGKAAWSPRESVLTGLAAAVPDWTKSGNRVLVTSRPYGLDVGQVRALDRCGLPEARIERLPESLQDLLATRWFVALPKTSAMGREFARDMLNEVRVLSQGVEALAGNPLLLTAICIIYGEGKQLPRDIHDLYDRIVKTSLHSRYPRDPLLIEPVRARLAAVALGMHTGDPFEPERTVPAAEIPFEELNQILAKYIGSNQETESGFRDQIDAREDLLNHSGLLSQGSSGSAGFYHLSFQEFLAAEQLAKSNEGVEKLLQVFLQRSTVLNWRPTLRFLLSRRVAIQGHKAVLELLDRMLAKVNLRSVAKSAGLTLNAVDGLAILLDRDLQLQQPVLERFTKICLKAIEQNVEVKTRAELALMLGRLGDPRVPESLDASNAWVTVPAGNYVFGDENHRFEIERPFGISKFPVTNAQFAAFIIDGYHTESLWHPAGWAWRSSNNITQPEYWDDPMWNGATCPVVGVSWWEADAFCRWARVRLATEREWEAAARGPDGFEYPWGNGWREDVCNSDESGLSRTSAVGIFPLSASHCGAHEMAGNVWEWCHDHYDPAEQKNDNASRVLRGGSWNIRADFCRSSFRFIFQPGYRNYIIGFRVARTL